MREHRPLHELWPPLAREKEKERKPLDDCYTTGSTSMLAGNRSGRAGVKEGADVAVGVWSPQERPKHEKMPRAETSERRTGDTLLGYSGRTGLRRERCMV
jgi:hypothetical protein